MADLCPTCRREKARDLDHAAMVTALCLRELPGAAVMFRHAERDCYRVGYGVLRRAFLHATSPCGGLGPMTADGGEISEPPCTECAFAAEVKAAIEREA